MYIWVGFGQDDAVSMRAIFSTLGSMEAIALAHKTHSYLRASRAKRKKIMTERKVITNIFYSKSKLSFRAMQFSLKTLHQGSFASLHCIKFTR